MGETLSALVARASFDPTSSETPEWRGNDRASYIKLLEVWRTLDELTSLLLLLREADSCVHIRLLIKLYYIGSSTLTDVLANVVNEVFDLGYPERAINLGSISRNRHVKDAGLADIIGNHAVCMGTERHGKIRNDIVHRNKLFDSELDALEAREADLMSSAALFHKGFGDATPEAFFSRESTRRGFAPKVRTLAIARANSLTDHLNATKAFIDDLDVALARRVARGA